MLFGTVLRLSCLNGRVSVECIIFGSLVHCNIPTCCTEFYIPVSHCERIGCVMKLHQFHLKEGTRRNTFACQLSLEVLTLASVVDYFCRHLSYIKFLFKKTRLWLTDCIFTGNWIPGYQICRDWISRPCLWLWPNVFWTLLCSTVSTVTPTSLVS